MEQGRCLICGQDVTFRKVLDVRDVVSREAFVVVACPSCGVLRTLPVPADLRPYYETDMGEMMKMSPSAVHTALKRLLLAAELRRLVDRGDPGTFLDVGCGTGDFASLIYQKGFRVVTVDAAEERPLMIRSIDAIPYHRIDFDRYEIQGLAPGGRYTVILRHVLEHVKDPRALLRRLIGYGASRCYIVVPNSASLERRLLGRYWNLWDPPRHLWHFDARSLQLVLHGERLRVLKMGYDTIPNLLPSLYRWLRLHQAPSWLYEGCSPKGVLTSLSTPLNALLPRNVLWVLGETTA